MKTKFETIDGILSGNYCPIQLSIIPNYMGINLDSVEGISWTKQDDGQLVNLTIHFQPSKTLFFQEVAPNEI